MKPHIPLLLAACTLALDRAGAEPSYTPEPGSETRVAICDALRRSEHLPSVKFAIDYLRVQDAWAIFDGVPLAKPGHYKTAHYLEDEYGSEPIAASLRRLGGKWIVIICWGHDDVPAGNEFQFGKAHSLPDNLAREYDRFRQSQRSTAAKH